MGSRHPSTDDLLTLDVDLRLYDVLLDAWTQSEWDGCALAAFLRLAYGRGYCDALTEKRRGELCREHGFAVPARRRK